MTTEEKAKRYDEALEQARKWYNNQNSSSIGKSYLYAVFPELKESEDEKVRKGIIELVRQSSEILEKKNQEQMLAWLEKQGEQKVTYTTTAETGDGGINALVTRELPTDGCDDGQKPADKAEPKFKAGDWITDGDINLFQIAKIDNGWYCTDDDDRVCFDVVHDYYHKWTIADVKDGDVLVYEGEIFMIKSYALWNKIVYHCCYDGEILHKHSIYDSWRKEDFDKVHPATKEQCDLLFEKIHEAGYEWDAEKKELKKIELIDEYEGLTDFERAVADACIGWIGEELGWKQYIRDNADVLLRIAIKKFNSVQDAPFEHKPTWSEEDEEMLKSIMATCELAEQERDSSPAKHLLEMQLNWLKAIKQRIKRNYDTSRNS